MKKFKNTWHLVHLMMTVLTGGLWALIWIYCTLSNNSYNSKVSFQAQQEQIRWEKRK